MGDFETMRCGEPLTAPVLDRFDHLDCRVRVAGVPSYLLHRRRSQQQIDRFHDFPSHDVRRSLARGLARRFVAPQPQERSRPPSLSQRIVQASQPWS